MTTIRALCLAGAGLSTTGWSRPAPLTNGTIQSWWFQNRSCKQAESSGRDTSSLRAAMTVADILVVPVLPASFDVWSLEPLDDLIQEAREINAGLSVVAVLNAADAQEKDNEEVAAAIREKIRFDYFPHPIVRRKAFRNAAAAGLSVIEFRPSDAKAVGELNLHPPRIRTSQRYPNPTL